MLAFTPAQREVAQAYETRQDTDYGSVYGRYFPSGYGDRWLAFVEFRLHGGVEIHRPSPYDQCPDEAAARAWIAAAIDAGPWWIVGVLPEREDQ